MTDLLEVFDVIHVFFNLSNLLPQVFSFWLLIVPEYHLTTKNLVVQFLAGTSTSGQSEHKPQSVLRLFHNNPEVFGDHLCTVWQPAGE